MARSSSRLRPSTPGRDKPSRPATRKVTFDKATLGGLPTLQVVGTIGGDRAYMLYIGNTRYNSNAILVSYHSARRSAADDDRMWARFIAGIRPD